MSDMTRRKALEGKLRAERDRSDALLLNILPVAIIPRLHGRLVTSQDNPIADFFPEGTVLFSDIVSFTSMSSELSARDVVTFLNNLFNLFDDLVAKFGLTKIKTIGDAYMVASGIPTPDPKHAEKMIEFAQAMLRGVELYNQKKGIKVRVRRKRVFVLLLLFFFFLKMFPLAENTNPSGNFKRASGGGGGGDQPVSV
jgi:class 3 adenylate cyclase